MDFVALEEVARIERLPASKQDCDSLPYVGLEHIEKDSGRFSSDFKQCSEQLLATKFKFTSCHVLYGKLRPYLNKVALPNFQGVCTTEILPILPNPKELDRGYLWLILLSPEFVSWASKSVSGANLPRLDPKDLAEYKIPLPQIAEQKRIAAIAQKCDRLRRTRRYTQQLSDSYLQTVFLQMFAETESRNWDLSNLEDLVKGGKNTIRTGPFGSQLLHEEFKLEGDVAVLGIDNVVQNSFAWDKKRFITSQKYQELKRYTVYPGDVLITIMGTCGRCVVAPQNTGLFHSN